MVLVVVRDVIVTVLKRDMRVKGYQKKYRGRERRPKHRPRLVAAQ